MWFKESTLESSFVSLPPQRKEYHGLIDFSFEKKKTNLNQTFYMKRNMPLHLCFWLGKSCWQTEAGAGGLCYCTVLSDKRQVVAPGTHQLTEAFILHLVFWDCEQRPRPRRLPKERVEQGNITAGNSEGMTTDAFRVPRGGSTGADQDLKPVRKR